MEKRQIRRSRHKMLVTKVEPVTKTKYRVELDQQFAFVLYKGELAKFSIREMEEIPEEHKNTRLRLKSIPNED